MKEIIREAVNNHMPDKESIRINAMQEPKAVMLKKAYAVLAVAIMIAICTCIAVPMMINEPELPPPVQVTPADTTTVNNDTTERITLSTQPADSSNYEPDDTTNTDDSPPIGGGWPICMFHEDSYHTYPGTLVQIVGEEEFRAWIDPIEKNWEYIPYTETECPFPNSNIVEFIKHFGITDEQLIYAYNDDFYHLQWDMEALLAEDYEAFEQHAIELRASKEYRKLWEEQSLKYSIFDKLKLLKDDASVKYYNSITDNGKRHPVSEVTILELVENSSLTREDIQKYFNKDENMFEYDLSLLFENREEYKRMISELEIPYYESEVKLIDALLHAGS